MGQQQLLLIVLGVIIVGIAVVVGINLFNANAEESAKDTIVSEGTNLGAMAQQFYKKPKALGGGGNSFANFKIPTKLDSTLAGGGGLWTPTDPNKDKWSATLVPSDYGWKVTVIVDSSGIRSSIAP
jgi:hypothetical protein